MCNTSRAKVSITNLTLRRAKHLPRSSAEMAATCHLKSLSKLGKQFSFVPRARHPLRLLVPWRKWRTRNKENSKNRLSVKPRINFMTLKYRLSRSIATLWWGLINTLMKPFCLVISKLQQTHSMSLSLARISWHTILEQKVSTSQSTSTWRYSLTSQSVWEAFLSTGLLRCTSSLSLRLRVCSWQ